MNNYLLKLSVENKILSNKIFEKQDVVNLNAKNCDNS